MSWMTGTRRAYRGRGLALAVKLASIEWAAANGITRMLTFNDATNAPMLADQPKTGLRADRPAGRMAQGARGNGFFASAASTCEVTQTGVVTYFAE